MYNNQLILIRVEVLVHNFSMVLHKDIIKVYRSSLLSFGEQYQILQGFQEQLSGIFRTGLGL